MTLVEVWAFFYPRLLLCFICCVTFRRMEMEGSQKIVLPIAQLNNAEELVMFKLSLEAKVVAQVTKILSVEVRARNAVPQGGGETAANFALRIGQVISSQVRDDLLPSHVSMDGDMDRLGANEAWSMKPAPVLNIDGNADITAQARPIARQLVGELLTFLCERRLGSSVEQVLRKAKQEQARAVVSTKISLVPPADMRGRAIRFFEQHVELHGSPSPSLAVADYFERLDAEVLKLMPGRSEAVALLEVPANDQALAVAADEVARAAIRLARYKEGAKTLAVKTEDIAEKLYVVKPPKKPAGPTVPKEDAKKRTGQDTKGKEGRDGNGAKIACWDCGADGQMRGHKGCSKGNKHTPKQQQQPQCNYCEQLGHFQRVCPEITCLKCKQKGHCQKDCPAYKPAVQPYQELAGSTTAATDNGAGDSAVVATVAVATDSAGSTSSSAAVATAAVLMVKGRVNGVETVVGLDSFAGTGLATLEIVGEQLLSPTNMQLQGVAPEAVAPYGDTDVQVTLGEGPGFVERVAVVDQLPGGVSLLVGFDTLERLGLEVSKTAVVLGGETCVRVEQVESTRA